VVFETRWTLSYLRGRMGRVELKRVSGGGAAAAKPSAAATNGTGAPHAEGGRANVEGGLQTALPQAALPKPVLPANVPEYFINANATKWRGVLYGSARVHYTDTKLKIDTTQDLNVIAHFAEGAVPVDWDSAEPADQRPEDLVGTLPNPNSSFEPLPPAALDARKYTAWTKDFGQWVMRAERLTLYSAPSLKLTSTAGESELDFKLRISQGARESRDAAVEKLRASYAPKVARLTQRIQTAEQGVAREQDQASQQRTQTMVSFGATVIGALLGRKAVSASTLGRATTAVRGVGRSVKESQDVARASEKLSEAQEELKALEAEINEEIAALTAVDAGAVAVETIEVKPKRGGVDVRLVALAWKPVE
jgi:phage host-nuclease inhibitor protein Gam